MADSRDIILSNLKGFLRKGARSDIQSYIPTGHFKLDFIINNGSSPDSIDLSSKEGYDPNKIGMPSGKLVELFGEEGSGKSSLAYRVVGYAQKMGQKCAWIDTEHSFSDNLAVINGVNQDELYYADMTNEDEVDTTYYAEDIFDAIIDMCKNGIKCIVLDSVANLSTKAAMEGSAHDIQMGDVARLMSKELRKIVNYAGKFGVLVIFINQIREKIGIMFGCFHGETLVSFADGRRLPIKEVVEQKLIGPILSYNIKTGLIESKEITNWFDNGDLEEDNHWLSFLCSGPGTKNGKLGFTCTPNHTLFLVDGSETSAEEVVAGDMLMSYREEKILQCEVHRDIIFGSILGDGCLILRSRDTACLSLANSEQNEYLSYKKHLLKMMNFKEIRSASYNKSRWDSEYSVELAFIRDLFYDKSGYRKIPDDLQLTPLMAAIWYMDDGCLKNEDGRKTPVPIISIKRLKNDQNQIQKAIDLVESLDVKLKGCVSYQPSNCCLAISSEGMDPFFRKIISYIDISMAYKVPDHYKEYCFIQGISSYSNIFKYGKDIVSKLVPYPSEVLKVDRSSKRKYRSIKKYDLEVNGNGTYVVGGGSGIVVHNSPETTPGGRSLRFNASLRIRLSKNNKKEAEIYVSDENDQVRMIGRKANAKIVKNRFAKPFMEVVDIPIYYEPYFPDIEDVLFEVGRQLKLISVRKGVYSWKEIKEEGKGKFLEKLKYTVLVNDLIEDIKSKSKELGTILPPELVSFEPAKNVKPHSANSANSVNSANSEVDESEDGDVAIPKKRVSRPGKGKHSTTGDEDAEE